MPNTPIVNKGMIYANTMNLVYLTATTMTLTAGQCRNSSNVNDITLSASVTINTATTGANGLDQGAMGNDTRYTVYAIGSSTGAADSAGIISTDASSPLLPGDYDMYLRVGTVLTNGSAQILPFFQSGNGLTRFMMYDTPIQELSNGTATTFTDVDFSSSVPDTATWLLLEGAQTPNSAANTLFLRRNGSGATNGSARIAGQVAAVEIVDQVWVPCDSGAIVEYKVSNGSDSADVFLVGYMDAL